MAVAKRTVELFYDVLSPYSWVAFEVLCRYRPKWNLDLQFRPFFLSGVKESAENNGHATQLQCLMEYLDLKIGNIPGVVPAKMMYFGKDLQRLQDFYGIPLTTLSDLVNTLFKKGTLPAMRLLTAINISHPDKTEHLTRELWMRIWSRDEDIVLPESLANACQAVGLSEVQTTALISRLSDQDIKDKLKETTQAALDAGAFGAPTIIAHLNGEKHMFFGSDRFLLIADLFGVQWHGPLKPASSNL